MRLGTSIVQHALRTGIIPATGTTSFVGRGNSSRVVVFISGASTVAAATRATLASFAVTVVATAASCIIALFYRHEEDRWNSSPRGDLMQWSPSGPALTCRGRARTTPGCLGFHRRISSSSEPQYASRATIKGRVHQRVLGSELEFISCPYQLRSTRERSKGRRRARSASWVEPNLVQAELKRPPAYSRKRVV